MLNIRFLPVLLVSVTFFSCSGNDPESFEAVIMQLHEQNRYEEALEMLRESDRNSEELSSEELNRLTVRTHLAYADYLTHDADHLEMRERMTDALRHFRRVLELDADNSQAKTHIDLIEGIYEQMGRDIPEGVAE